MHTYMYACVYMYTYTQNICVIYRHTSKDTLCVRADVFTLKKTVLTCMWKKKIVNIFFLCLRTNAFTLKSCVTGTSIHAHKTYVLNIDIQVKTLYVCAQMYLPKKNSLYLYVNIFVLVIFILCVCARMHLPRSLAWQEPLYIHTKHMC